MDDKNKILTTGSDSKYWNSVDQFEKDPEFLKKAENEFLSSPLAEESNGGWARREFLKLMGASLAMGSLSCIRRPSEKIVPYAKRPKNLTPGLPNYYASFFKDGHELFSSVVTQREARPIKMEGNERAKFLNGPGLSARAQASFLSLYDANRLKSAKKNLLSKTRLSKDTVSVSWDVLDKEVVAALKKGKVAILTPSLSSEALSTLVKDFRYRYGVSHYTWDTEDLSSWVESQNVSYISKALPTYHFEKADVTLSVGCDFLGTYHQPTAYTKDWAEGRKKVRDTKKMSRLYVAEGQMSLTGSNADYRFPVNPSDFAPLLMEVLYELTVVQKRSLYASWSELKTYLESARQQYTFRMDAEKLQKLVKDLWAARGKALVVTGGGQSQVDGQLALHVLANILNSALGAEGKTVRQEQARLPQGSYKNLARLVKAINAGQVKTLIVHGCNPVYAGAVAGLDIDAAFKKLNLLVTTSQTMDETAQISHFVATDHHFLESWSEARPFDHLHLVGQPLVAPLYETRSFGDSLVKWTGKKGSWHGYLKNYFRYSVFNGLSFDANWDKALKDGFVKKRAAASSSRLLQKQASLRVLKTYKPSSDEGYKLSCVFNSSVRDGSLANLSWLQELPDPVTKVCWGNYVSVSYDDAKSLGLKEGQLLLISADKKQVKLPVHIQPGQAKGLLVAHLGYGRWAGGAVCEKQGVNVYPLAKYSDSQVQFSGLSVSVKKLAEVQPIANTQSHHSMHDRELIVKTSLKDYKKGVSPYHHGDGNNVPSIWNEYKYKKKWSMAVDLNSCTGCSACVIACQAENNIPVVGKKLVLKGRQMHWMRLDRYYEGQPKDPTSTNVMPVMCQHCDNAPCETVCPVIATVHSNEGTNDMIYNRCVGTRYCANNCPYKVRRFNWFNYEKRETPMELALNPEVSVRSRGVMEKCSFCIQRINSHSWMEKQLSEADKKKHLVPLKTACQQSCPTQAISFGDIINDKGELSKAYEHKDAYSLLGGLNTKPAVRYLYRVQNVDSHGGHGKSDGKGDH